MHGVNGIYHNTTPSSLIAFHLYMPPSSALETVACHCTAYGIPLINARRAISRKKHAQESTKIGKFGEFLSNSDEYEKFVKQNLCMYSEECYTNYDICISIIK